MPFRFGHRTAGRQKHEQTHGGGVDVKDISADPFGPNTTDNPAKLYDASASSSPPPHLTPLSDPSSDEYDSSPEKPSPSSSSRAHVSHRSFKSKGRNRLSSPAQNHGRGQNHGHGHGLFHWSSPLKKQRDAASAASAAELRSARIAGTARGAARAQHDSQHPVPSPTRPSAAAAAGVSSAEGAAAATGTVAGTAAGAPAEDNGFLRILLGEHFATMEKLNENAPTNPQAYQHPFYASGSEQEQNEEEGNKNHRINKKAEGNQYEAYGASDKAPMSSLQRHLAKSRTSQGKRNGSSSSSVGSSSNLSSLSASASANTSGWVVATPSPTRRRSPLSGGIGNGKHGRRNDANMYPSPSSPNHRFRTRWERSHQDMEADAELESEPSDDEEEDGLAGLPSYYEACDEMVNRLGIGKKPQYVADSPVRSSDSAAAAEMPATAPLRTIDEALSLTTDVQEASDEDDQDDNACRKLTFDLSPNGNAEDASSRTGRIVRADKGKDDGTVSVLSAGSALSTLRRSLLGDGGDRMEKMDTVADAAAPPVKSSLQLAMEKSRMQQQRTEAVTPPRSNVSPRGKIGAVKARSLGVMTLDEPGIDTSASLGRFGTKGAPSARQSEKRSPKIATVPVAERLASVGPSRGGAGIVPSVAAKSKSTADRNEVVGASASHRPKSHRQGHRSNKNTVYLLLLDPDQKIFELCSIRYDPSSSTVGGILDLIAHHATEPGLSALKYWAFVRPDDGKEFWRTENDYKCARFDDGEVLVAVPKFHEPPKCCKIAVPILNDPKLNKLLKRARRKAEQRKGKMSDRRAMRSKGRARSKSRSRGVKEAQSHQSNRISRNDESRKKVTRFSDDRKSKPASMATKKKTPASGQPQPALAYSSASTSPSIEELTKAVSEAASASATQAIEEKITNLEKRLSSSRTEAQIQIENDLRRRIQMRANASADAKENAPEESKPAYLRIEELARKATSSAKKEDESQVLVGDQADECERKAHSTSVGGNSIQLVAISTVSAVLIRSAVSQFSSAVSQFISSLFGGFGATIGDDKGLESYIPLLDAPDSQASSSDSFGFADILVLACFFAILLKIQQSVCDGDAMMSKTRTRKKKNVRSLISSPRTANTRKVIISSDGPSNGKGLHRSRSPNVHRSNNPWGDRHCSSQW